MSSLRLSHLFRQPPESWGLRGDPFLWDELARELAEQPWPVEESALQALLEQAYARLAGVPLSNDESFFVEHFAHGGMSSGYLSPCFWRDTAFSLLLSRFRRAQARS